MSPTIWSTIVAARISSIKSFAMFGCTSGAAHTASVAVPAATAALSASATSGVDSFQRAGRSPTRRLDAFVLRGDAWAQT